MVAICGRGPECNNCSDEQVRNDDSDVFINKDRLVDPIRRDQGCPVLTFAWGQYIIF